MSTMVGHQIRRARNLFNMYDTRRQTMMCEGHNVVYNPLTVLKVRPFSRNPDWFERSRL